ncbi:uncharacterized protein LOC129938957 [Eupeodes corollae]|uniref:uncharacterized protein LOC129938957 n=1 Tax=Eupeodes corollae TaxID=290404 RepID=UPI00249162C3|nr:uncharacterized protein LOC129938957 [Eupeodes corollae]
MSKAITNKKEMEILVRLMQDIAKGVCVKSQANPRWEKFASELNGDDPPMRTWEKWLKVWTGFKFNTKKKMSQNKVEQKATGGGPNKLHTFIQLGEAVIKMLDINTVVDPSGVELGNLESAQNNNLSSQENIEENNELEVKIT